MASALKRALQLLSRFQNNVSNNFFFPFPKDNLALAIVNAPTLKYPESKKIDIKELFGISILWGVPKRRRSIEKRRCRRIGWPQYIYKLLVPKTNILTCETCGSYHEAGVLCPTCYSKVKKVTEEMQEAIEKELGISPVEKEVVVLYEGADKSNTEFYEGKRIVEIKKPMPKIFSDNLLQKSTQRSGTTKEVSDIKQASLNIIKSN